MKEPVLRFTVEWSEQCIPMSWDSFLEYETYVIELSSVVYIFRKGII